jgi:hypothetical protein
MTKGQQLILYLRSLIVERCSDDELYRRYQQCTDGAEIAEKSVYLGYVRGLLPHLYLQTYWGNLSFPELAK